MRNSIALLALLFTTIVFADTQVTKRKKHLLSDTSHLKSITTANNKFATSLYKTLVDNNVENNIVVSPISIHVALALMYLGASGRTAQQMAAGLHIPEDHNAVRLGFRHLMSALKGSNSVDLEIANRLYLQSSFTILKEFRRSARKAFGSDVKEVNFDKNPEKTRKIINAWIEKRTRQNIKQVIEPGVLTTNTKMVLVNAVYFKAEWLTPFNSQDTKNEPFHISPSATVDVPMMNIKTYFKLKSEDGMKILELPYKDDRHSMMVILPDNDISQLQAKVSTINLAEVFKTMPVEDEVLVKLPKFRIEKSMQLKDNLKELGFKDMFSMEAANFTGITGQRDLHITHILQKAFIDVTELGTEAGASTAIVLEPRMWKPPPPKFIADRPFMCVLWDKKLETMLFIATLNNPNLN